VGWIAPGPIRGLAVALPDLSRNEPLVVERPRQTFFANFENTHGERRIRAGRGKLFYDFPLKGNPHVKLGDLAVGLLELGIPVAQPMHPDFSEQQRLSIARPPIGERSWTTAIIATR
jgi:hypothetical protein